MPDFVSRYVALAGLCPFLFLHWSKKSINCHVASYLLKPISISSPVAFFRKFGSSGRPTLDFCKSKWIFFSLQEVPRNKIKLSILLITWSRFESLQDDFFVPGLLLSRRQFGRTLKTFFAAISFWSQNNRFAALPSWRIIGSMFFSNYRTSQRAQGGDPKQDPGDRKNGSGLFCSKVRACD